MCYASLWMSIRTSTTGSMGDHSNNHTSIVMWHKAYEMSSKSNLRPRDALLISSLGPSLLKPICHKVTRGFPERLAQRGEAGLELEGVSPVPVDWVSGRFVKFKRLMTKLGLAQLVGQTPPYHISPQTHLFLSEEVMEVGGCIVPFSA